MANYSGFEPQRPFGSFIAGMGAADQMRHTALKNEAMQAAIDQQKRQRETAEQFAATGDPRELRGYDPALAVSIENSLATMDTNKQQAAIKRLTAGIDITDKALPYIVAASKSNPAAAASMWPEYIADLTKAGIQPPPFMQQYSPETLELVQKQKEDFKTAVARIQAASRMGAAQLGAQTRLTAAEIQAKARVDAADISATKAPKTIWGSMADAAKTGDWDQFDFYKNLWDQQHPGVRPQLFKSVTGNNYKWVTPAADQEPPAGFRPVTEDAFKALLGSLAGTTIPSPDATPAPQSSATPTKPTGGGPTLQERATAELARRRNAGKQ